MIRSIRLDSHICFADDARAPGLAILQNGLNFESHIVTEWRRLAPRAKGFLDLGANVGYHTLVVKGINASLPVVCVECSPFNVDILCKNVIHNKLTDTLIYPVPVADTTRIIHTNECAENMCCSVEGTPDSEGYPRLAPAFALDDLKLPLIDLVKIDIEGLEIAALRGASRLMSTRPTIIFEFCPEITHRSGVSPVAMLQWFIDRGYALTTLDYIPGMRATFDSASKCLDHVKETSKWIGDILATPMG